MKMKAKGGNFLHTHWTLLKVGSGGGGGVLYGAFLILINYAGGMSIFMTHVPHNFVPNSKKF
jgi:hypothetical protein